MSIFVSAYGAKTGDYALNFMSTGGVFICGIIAARNLSKMKDPVFMESFLSKGRMRGLLQDMPVKIVLNDDCGLMGVRTVHAGAKSIRQDPDGQLRTNYSYRGVWMGSRRS